MKQLDPLKQIYDHNKNEYLLCFCKNKGIKTNKTVVYTITKENYENKSEFFNKKLKSIVQIGNKHCKGCESNCFNFHYGKRKRTKEILNGNEEKVNKKQKKETTEENINSDDIIMKENINTIETINNKIKDKKKCKNCKESLKKEICF
jgi:hypothetical protein